MKSNGLMKIAVPGKPAELPPGFIEGKVYRAKNGQRTNVYDTRNQPVYAFNKAGEPICYSPRTNNRSKFCQRRDRNVGGRCNKHGGNSNFGLACSQSTTLKNSRYTRHLNLPEHRRKVYDALIDDPNLLSLRPEIASTDSRIDEVEASLTRRNSVEALRLIDKAWKRYQGAKAAQDAAEESRAGLELMKLIEEGAGDYQTNLTLERLYDKRRRLVDSEDKRQRSAEMHIAFTQLRDVTGRIIAIIGTNVIDNIEAQRDAFKDGLRAALFNAQIDAELINTITGAIVPLSNSHFDSAGREMLRGIQREIIELYQLHNISEVINDGREQRNGN